METTTQADTSVARRSEEDEDRRMSATDAAHGIPPASMLARLVDK